MSLPLASSSAVLVQIFSLGAAAVVGALGLLAAARSVYPRALVPWALALLVLIGVVTLVPGALRLALRAAFTLGRRGGEIPAIDAGFGARWLGLHLPAWLGYGIAFGLLWASFPALPPVAWAAALGGFAGAYFLGYAALFAPAGVGVREGAMALLLAPWTGAAEAALLAVIARLWMTVAELIPLAAVSGGRALARLRKDSPGR